MSEEKMEAFNVSKAQIRALVSNVYDMQKLRISAGNRLVQSFYSQLGIKPSESPDNADKEGKKLIDTLKKEYVRITDGIASGSGSVRKKIAEMSKEGENPLEYIHSETDYHLVKSYMLLMSSEEESIKVLDKYVKSHPLWDRHFAGIKGVGTLMAACCIAYLDPYKAPHVSCFFRYCGLDTVQDVDKDGNKLYLTKDGTYRKVREKVGYLDVSGLDYFGKVKPTDDYDAEGNQIFRGEDGEVLTQYQCKRMVDGEELQVYETVDELHTEYVGEVVVSEHGRRMADTEMQTYKDKNGEEQLKRGITYNPVIKTKLMGVLTGCLLKAKDPVYSQIYYDVRKRYENSEYHKGKTAGHINMMAQRYMIKQFLRNLWVTWRDMEDLPVDEPYEIAKLGNLPHHINDYQHEMAQKWRAKMGMMGKASGEE